LPVISADTLAEARKDATPAGLVLMMHANSFEAQKFAVDGNVDIIAHGMWNWGISKSSPNSRPKSKACWIASWIRGLATNRRFRS
jgi:hypothetical protein